MTIITRQRTGNYALIPNSVAEDSRLSFEARGLLCYLLAKPNNWKVVLRDIQEAGGIGRDKTYRLLKELREVGYVTLDIKRGPGNRIEEQNYIVYDCAVPDRLPLPEKPEVARPVPEKPEEEKLLPENPASGVSGSGKAGRLNKNPYLIKPTRYIDGRFQAFWESVELAHRHCHREAAETLYLNLPADIDRTNAVEIWPLHHRIEVLRGRAPKLIAYLKSKVWRELLDAPAVNKDGLFKITPDREEWSAWIDEIRAKHGDVGVESTKRGGIILRKERWPQLTAPRQLSMGGV